MRNGSSLDALIVGAGMVGAALALGLARAGLRVGLIEPHPPVPPSATDPVDLRVVAIAPHAQRLLERLRVWPEIVAVRAAPYERMHVRDAQSGASIDFAAVDYGWSCLGHIVENRLIAGALWRALQAEVDVRLLAGERLDGFEEDAGGLRVRLAGGSRWSSRLLVAADGAASQVREQLLIGVEGGGHGQSGLVAHVEPERSLGRLAWQRFLPSGPLALLPLADGRSSMVWTLPSARADALRVASEGKVETALLRASDGVCGRLRLTSARATFPLRTQIARRFAQGRCILVGDAAHVVHPLAGQGVNLGFADVAALLADVEAALAAGREPFADSRLSRWGRARRSEATLAGRAFGGLNRLYAVSEGPLVAARSFGLRAVDRLTPLKRRLAERAAGILAAG